MASRAFKILPKNYLAEWGEFESWALGTGSAPDGWRSSDPYTKLLLHCDGAEASTAFTDSSPNPKTITSVGGASIGTSDKVFGTGAGVLDGTNDYLTTPDHADLNIGTDNFTMGLRLKFDSLTAGTAYHFITKGDHGLGTASYSLRYLFDTTSLNFYYSADGTNLTQYDHTWVASVGTWYNITVSLQGTTFKAYIDGTQVGATGSITEAFYESTQPLILMTRINNGSVATTLDGKFDELIIMKGIGAFPSDFPNPTSAFSQIVPNVARESTNKKFGNYGAMVAGTDILSLGALYRTIPNSSDYQGRTFSLGAWGMSASTGPYLMLSDGVNSKTVHLTSSSAMAFFTTPPMKIDYSATEIKASLVGYLNATAYFDSAVLCEGEDLFTTFDTNIDISEFSPTLNMKQDQYEIAQREGSFIPETHLQSRNIRLKGSVVGTDVVSTRSNFDSLMKSVLAWQVNEKRNLYLYDDRVLEVFLKGFDWNYLNGLQMIRFNAQMSAPDSTTRSINKYRTRQVISGTVTEFSLPYNGSALSKPVISFVADQGSAISTCVLENLTTGENFSYSGTVPTNVALDIDCDLGTVFNSSVDFISQFSGDFLGVVRGTNNFRFSGSNCTINIDYYERFL